MPTYEYICLECEHNFEHFQKITETPLQRCPVCHKDCLQRGPGGGIGLQFKGSGFYITDYKDAKKTDSKPAPEKASKCCKDPKNCKKKESAE